MHFGGKIQKNIFDITTIGNYIVAGVLARGNPLPHAKGQIISEKKILSSILPERKRNF